jgi:DNA-3-methyladenine glycosylase II
MPRTTNQTGIQKNLCKWFSHDPALAPSIHPRKLAGASPTKLGAAATSAAPESPSKSQSDAQTDTDSAATVPSARKTHEGEGVGLGKLAALGGASVEQELVVDLDQPATPPRTSTKQEEEVVEFAFPETSNNLTPAILKSRLNGKKLKYASFLSSLTLTVKCCCIIDANSSRGNIYMTPQEMEEMTAAWAPYRSIACWCVASSA